MNMNENRQTREQDIGAQLAKLDSVAINSAQMEFTCWLLKSYAAQERLPFGGALGKSCLPLQQAGLNLLYRLCNNVTADQLLFPALMMCFENCIELLGRVSCSLKYCITLSSLNCIIAKV